MVKNTTCDRCGLNLSTYQKYQQHLNRKNPCRPKNLTQAPAIQNPAPIPAQNTSPVPIPEGDLISFDENPPTHQPTQPREASAPAVDLLIDLTIDELIKWLSKPSDSEYDTADEDLDVYFEKIKDPYINRKSEAEKFNEGEVCDYYAFVPREYHAESEPLAFFESVEEKIADVYKRELALKGGLKVRIVLIAKMKKIEPETQEPKYKTFPFKHETIKIIREDRINATIEKGYNEIIDQIEDEAIQESGWSFVRAEEVFLEISAFRPLRDSNYLPLPEALDKPQLGLINPQNNDDNECFKWCISAYYTREEALKNLHILMKYEDLDEIKMET